MGWHLDSKGYVYRKKYLGKVNGKDRYRNLFLHRFILDEPIGKTIDHINGDKLDNRRKNLRICSQAQNVKNMKAHKNNTSGFKGVYIRTDGRKMKYTAQLVANRKVHVKSFETILEAVKAYNEMAIKYHGEFARLNNIMGGGELSNGN